MWSTEIDFSTGYSSAVTSGLMENQSTMERVTVQNNSAVMHCPDIQEFGNAYKDIHGYASLTVCTFGMIANILNVIVLTRKEMITPTNSILTALAIADLLNMVEYVPFVIYMKFLPAIEDNQLRRTYAWAIYVLFHSNFSQVCHTTSILLTLTLAIWRYIMVTRPVQCKTLCSMSRAKFAIALAYIASPILCIPIFCSFAVSSVTLYKSTEDYFTTTSTSILEATIPYSTNITLNSTSKLEVPSTSLNSTSVKYVVNLSSLAKTFPLLKQFNFWFFSIVIKLIPCAILTVVSFRLVNFLLEVKKRKAQLFGENINRPKMTQSSGNNDEIPSRNTSFTRSTGEMCATKRTTRMLLAILFLFLLTELPQGVLALLSDLMGEEFFNYCYMSLSDLMDFMALLNSGINFILYCTMSSKFRIVFRTTFSPKYYPTVKIFP